MTHSRFISPVSVPSKPRTSTDEDLAEACGVALADDAMIDFAEYGGGSDKPWIKAALTGNLTKRRNSAVAAVHAVYGARIETLRMEYVDDPFVCELSDEDQQALRILSGFNRQDRPKLAHALWELKNLQWAEIHRRREKLDEVRQHACEREQRLRDHKPSGAPLPQARLAQRAERRERDRDETRRRRGDVIGRRG